MECFVIKTVPPYSSEIRGWDGDNDRPSTHLTLHHQTVEADPGARKAIRPLNTFIAIVAIPAGTFFRTMTTAATMAVRQTYSKENFAALQT
jgi:hypothetical protein